MRTLGIDFGERRIGIAISDPEGRLAVPLKTLERRRDRAAIGALVHLVAEEAVEALVIGEPRGLDGRRGEAAERAVAFGRRLANATGLPLETIDEALTSVAAAERLRAAGVDLRKHPERIDAVAAQLLLQDALDRRARDQPSPP
ncbi:MAG: Holliday junction resolvase RuvX [Acidobacteriota bacterium]